MTDPYDPARIGTAGAPGVAAFISEMAGLPGPAIIEVGTLRSDPNFPTHHTAWAPHGTWLKVDAFGGTDVDVVDDAHTLSIVSPQLVIPDAGPADGARMFDAYVACSLFEHLRRPWLAAKAAARVVRPGGLVYIQTHQTFPLHGYPNDYFRFSKEALAGILEDAGLEIVTAGYVYRCTIEPPAEVTRWNRAPDVESWLNVEALARKPEA